MIRSSETLGQLAAALAAAQATMGHASKDAKNPHFKSSYASLAAVIEAIREPLSRQGIAFTSLASTDAKSSSINCRPKEPTSLYWAVSVDSAPAANVVVTVRAPWVRVHASNPTPGPQAVTVASGAPV